MAVHTYYGELRSLWGDEEELIDRELSDLEVACKSTRCLNAKKTLDNVMKFLMGTRLIFREERKS